jgi:hypothetical protein
MYVGASALSVEGSNDLLRQRRFVFRFALPHDYDAEPRAPQFRLGTAVPLAIPLELREPVFAIVLRHSCSIAPSM